MHQVSYPGEWHTHSRGAAAGPGAINRAQPDELAADLSFKEKPAVLVIVAAGEMRISTKSLSATPGAIAIVLSVTPAKAMPLGSASF
ncbi:hypothetical protein [Cribrihabitans pelagius]|uniref:hypothetical protein n=1 Tax=Cribrihabitans pelagius TaxID=1765746 RepID=UPI003B5C6761